MKAYKAPEKIYIHVKDGKALNTWNGTWIGVHDIEYIRKDAFIEKACEYIYSHAHVTTFLDIRLEKGSITEFVDDFRKAMEE